LTALPLRSYWLAMAETRQRLRWFGRSPLSRHLVERYDELSAEITEYRRAPWTAIAAEIAKAGIRDAKGQAPSPKAVRDAFLRVKEAMEMRAAVEPNAPHPKRQSPPSAAVTLTTTESSSQEEDEERPRYKFGPSKPKDWTKP